MIKDITFIRFEYEYRQYSPNAIVGIHEQLVKGKPREKKIFIMAASACLGKELGDKMAVQIKALLETEYTQPEKQLQQHDPLEPNNK